MEAGTDMGQGRDLEFTRCYWFTVNTLASNMEVRSFQSQIVDILSVL